MTGASSGNALPLQASSNETLAVSIIVPVYNGARTIRACLESLLALHPHSPKHQIIVVDNGSTDGTAELVRQYENVELIHEERRGPAAARNAGLAHARGELVAFIDSDCIALPQWLTEGVVPFTDLNVVGVAGAIAGVTSANPIQEWLNDRGTLDPLKALGHPFLPYIQTANAIYRREAVRAVDGFAESISVAGGEDCDLSWRILTKTGGRFDYAPEALVYHDHRTTVGGVFRQAAAAGTGAVCLAKMWGTSLPKRNWKTSVWECVAVATKASLWIRTVVSRRTDQERLWAMLDFVQAAGIKWGRIVGSLKMGRISQC